MSVLNGLIIHSISGFYYVQAADTVYSCKARGVFRKEKITPVTGDRVEIEVQNGCATVIRVLPRKNVFIRPPIANVDILFIISSVVKPKPNLFVLDKLSALAVQRNVRPVFVFSKEDAGNASEFVDVYRKAGFDSFSCSAKEKTGMDIFRDYVDHNVCAFTGNSGVGKSSILNALIPELNLQTNEISEKLGRGKHTTRSVSLYPFNGGFVADTPGFSSMEFDVRTEPIYRDELPFCFPEFARFSEKCRFSASCSHVNTKDCGVIRAVEGGMIPVSRYESYVRMYGEVKDIADWNKR